MQNKAIDLLSFERTRRLLAPRGYESDNHFPLWSLMLTVDDNGDCFGSIIALMMMLVIAIVSAFFFFFFESSAVAVCSDGGLRTGLQYTSHHHERQSLVGRSVESIFSPLCPGMYFAVILMAAGLSCMSPVFSAAICGELLQLISTRLLFLNDVYQYQTLKWTSAI